MREALNTRPATQAHLFKRGETNLYCLSHDPGGRNIPRDPSGETWRYVRTVELHAQEQRLAVNSDEAIADLAQRGYHFVHGWYQQQ